MRPTWSGRARAASLTSRRAGVGRAMLKIWPLIAIALLAGSASCLPARAAPPPAARAGGVARGAGIAPEQARGVLDILQNEQRRAELITTLQTIARAAPAAPVTPAATPPAAPAGEPRRRRRRRTGQGGGGVVPTLAPDSLGVQLFSRGSAMVSEAGQQSLASVRTVNDLPLLWRWITSQASDPIARSQLADAAWKLAVVFLCALPAESGVGAGAAAAAPDAASTGRRKPEQGEHSPTPAAGGQVGARAQAQPDRDGAAAAAVPARPAAARPAADRRRSCSSATCCSAPSSARRTRPGWWCWRCWRPMRSPGRSWRCRTCWSRRPRRGMRLLHVSDWAARVPDAVDPADRDRRGHRDRRSPISACCSACTGPRMTRC